MPHRPHLSLDSDHVLHLLAVLFNFLFLGPLKIFALIVSLPSSYQYSSTPTTRVFCLQFSTLNLGSAKFNSSVGSEHTHTHTHTHTQCLSLTYLASVKVFNIIGLWSYFIIDLTRKGMGAGVNLKLYRLGSQFPGGKSKWSEMRFAMLFLKLFPISLLDTL